MAPGRAPSRRRQINHFDVGLVPRLYDVDAGAVEVDGHDVRTINFSRLASRLAWGTRRTRGPAPILPYANLMPATTTSAQPPGPRPSTTGSWICRTDTHPRRRARLTSCPAAKSNASPSAWVILIPILGDEATSALDTHPERLIQRRLDQPFRVRVQGTGRLVEDQDAGVLEDDPGEGDALLFAAGICIRARRRSCRIRPANP